MQSHAYKWQEKKLMRANLPFYLELLEITIADDIADDLENFSIESLLELYNKILIFFFNVASILFK